MKQEYQIVYLNGPSSSGKTTIARALQNRMQRIFLTVGIDTMIEMMPEKLNDWVHDVQALGFSFLPEKDENGNVISYRQYIGPYGKRMIDSLKDIVVVLARAGHNIVIDDVSFGKQDVDAWRVALRDFNVLWVGLIAPLAIIEQRERERKNRRIGMAHWQTEHVHTGVQYDVILDTYTKTVPENIEILARYLE